MPKDEKTTVGELIAALRQFPTDMRVVVSGVEDGYDDLTEAARVPIVVGRRKPSSYDGKHMHGHVEGADNADAVVLRYGG